ncbi:hypothetical protein ACFY0F_03885, partial [Streptomyces sp. NPDC001544]|uniref:hypothetical protein n=1 Tax=Streptomyces sp. NPDC001544 TaxID=3364584 RepID=UPI00369E7AC8
SAEPVAKSEAAATSEEAAAPDAASAPDTAAESEAAAAAAGDGAEPLAADVPGVPGSEVPRDHAQADDERSARRRSPVAAAAVAAAVLLIGGGGAYLTATANGASDSGTGSASSGGTPPPLALDGRSEGIAPGEPNPYGITYKAEGTLPGGPGSAPVYRAGGEVAKEDVARLAKALGLTGTPVAEGQTWRVGSTKDGSGTVLQVGKEAPGNWTYSRYATGTDNCRKVISCAQDPADPAVDQVSEAAARKAAAPVLKALGQDDAKIDASRIMGARRVVNADPVVGGLPTYGWTTGLTVGEGGQVVGGHGELMTPVKGDTYPVVGAKKTLDLMNATPGNGSGSGDDHRMGIGGCASPVPQKDRLEQPCGTSPSGTAVPAPARETVTVRKAVFGLAAHSVDGRQALVPSWLFQVRGAADAYTVTYPAVDPKYLASSSTPSDGTPSAPSASPAEQSVKVTGYSTTDDSTSLTVAFEGGVCADYKVSAAEDSGKVTVTVTETPWKDKVCILIAKVYHRTVHLDQPLGDRKVVGSDGQEVPMERPGARLPKSS